MPVQGGREIVERGVLDVDARARRALLARQAERRARDAGGSDAKVGVARDDRAVLPAHFRDAGPRPSALREGAHEMHADGGASGEGDARNVRMIDQRLADRATRTGDEVDGPCGQAGVAKRMGEEAAAPRRCRRRLEHDGVACDERRSGGSSRQRQREVERRDHDPRPAGLQHAAVLAHACAQRVVEHARNVAGVALHLVAVVRNEIRGFLCLAERLHAILATSSASAAPMKYTRSSISATARRSNRTRSSHGVAAHDGNARRAASTASLACTSSPAWKRPSTTRVSMGECAGELPRRAHVAAADQHRVLAAEVRSNGREGALEAVVQLLRRIEHRGIRELE
jgi:hypothetical protein